MPENEVGRGRKKRQWIRLDCQGVLHGSINYIFTLEEQAVFLKMIPMAAMYGVKPGIISDNDGKPLPHEYIAYELHCPLEVLESVLKKGELDNAIHENEHGITLANFEKYQFTEYDRQKPYREKKEEGPDKYFKGKFGKLVKGEPGKKD